MKPKPKAKAKPKADAKSKVAPKAPMAKPKPKSESSKLTKGKTGSAVESDPGTSSSSMVVEPPTSEVLTAPYGDEEGDDFPGIEKLFEDYIPEEHSDVAVDDPAPEAVRSPPSSSKPGGSHASRRSDEVPKSASAREKAIREEAAEVARRLIEEKRGAEASSSSRRPAGVADNLKDHWERQGNQLVRYHYTPWKGMFSPDLTDCPVNSNMLSSTRTTHSLSMGSQHITTDMDDWSVKRRRNCKFSFHWIGKTVFELKPASAGIGPDDLDKFPCMPTVPHSPQHREKVARHFPADEEEMYALLALVARPVNKKELHSNPEA